MWKKLFKHRAISLLLICKEHIERNICFADILEDCELEQEIRDVTTFQIDMSLELSRYNNSFGKVNLKASSIVKWQWRIVFCNMILVRKLILTVILNKIFCTEEFLNEKCGMFDYHKKPHRSNSELWSKSESVAFSSSQYPHAFGSGAIFV